MSSQELRNKFLSFFKERGRGHTIVPSSSLLPDDTSVLLTTAGMQQFKLYFVGKADPMKDFGSLNTVSIQKSFRTSDIDSVGDESHLTFFEMLGNFSFGGYFKKGAIEYAHEFITKELALKIDYVSVFKGDPSTSSGQVVPEDKESKKIWENLGVKDIREGNREDNFWGPTGSEGPCGPTTEVYVKGVEIWNIVFNEYYCSKDKKLEKLKTPGVDTGMGLERLAMMVQKKKNIFETDLFEPIMSSVIEGFRDKPIEKVRLIADHLRATVFIISDGILPGKDERNYIPRLLIRRAMSAHYLYMGAELDKNFFHNPVNTIINIYKSTYTHLEEKREEIFSVIQKEIENFSKVLLLIGTINDFERIYNGFIPKANLEGASFKARIKNNIADLDPRILFRIRETHGVNFQIMKMIIEKSELQFSRNVESKYDEEYKKHQEISRAGVEKKFGGHGLIIGTSELKAGSKEEVKKVTRLHTATHLLNQALHDVLGEEVEQRGSDVTPERTRFDFKFSRKVTSEEIKKIEDIVNEKIAEDLPVTVTKMKFEDALKSGARAFRPEKYPEVVKVYSIGHYSRELCGGPHVERTGEIGKFKLIKEESSSAGVRRIKAIVKP